MSEYLYGQEGLQQECDTEGRTAEVTFLNIFIRAPGEVLRYFHYPDSP